MSLGKLPGIKGLVSGSQGKRRIKSDLSVDMISPPLGDFRHTMHVGRGGDVFGDTSFLSNHGGVAGGNSSPDSATGSGFFSRTFRHVRRTPARPHYGSRDFSPPPPPISPIIKNAISLPQLNIDASNGCLQRALFSSSPSSPGDISYIYGMQSGFLTLPRPSRGDRQLQDGSRTYSPEPQCESFPDDVSLSLGRFDSLTSFTVDLGPSLMSEVFAMIDSTVCGLDTNHSRAEEEPEELTVSTPVTHPDTLSTEEMAPRKDQNGRESPGIQRWADDGRSVRRAMSDVVVFTTIEEPGIEPERFQRAADVLARHYGGGGVFKRQQKTTHRDPQNVGFDSSAMAQKRAPYVFPEEEDEIKV